MTQGSYERRMTTHYKDLRGTYAKRMECHGVGMALMQPISGEDCCPVSAGYFDRNGDWNLITRLTGEMKDDVDDYFYPLEYAPKPATQVEIAWQPKTSLGTTAITLDGSVETPQGLPAGAGADVHIKYSSNSKFGAVLMTTNPVTLRAYNDEALFCSWLSRNQQKLYERYGPELKKYGLWIVTRTYTTQRASINAWMDKSKDSVVSLKAKAAMLGELGEDLDWREKASDKDWSYYTAKTPHGVVVFMDGIEVKPIDWWLEGVRANLASGKNDRGRRLLKYMPDPVHHQATFDTHNFHKTLQEIDHEAAQKQLHDDAEKKTKDSRRDSKMDSRRDSSYEFYSRSAPPPAMLTPPRMRARNLSDDHERPSTLVADDDVLKDAGLSSISRSPSIRKGSAPSIRSQRSQTHSLRREVRSISIEHG